MPPVRQARSASVLRWGVLLAIAGYIRKPIFDPDVSGLSQAWVCRSAPLSASCVARRAKAGGADDGSSVAQVEAPRSSSVAKGAEKVVERGPPAGGSSRVPNQANPAEELSAAVVSGMSSAAASLGNTLQNAAASWAQGVVDSINDSAKRSAEEAKQLPGRMVTGAVSFAADKAEELKSSATSYAQAQVDAAVESVKAAPKAAADKTVEGLSGVGQAAANTVKQSINDGVDSIKAIPKVAADSLTESVNQGADNLKKSINSGVDSFGKKISAEVSASVDATVEQAKAAPKRAVNGLVEGISTVAQQSATVAQQGAVQVGNSAKSALQSRVEEAVQATRAAPARIQTDLEVASEQVLRRSQDAILNSPRRSISSMSSALQETVTSASQQAQTQVTEKVQGFGPWVADGVTTRIDEVKKDTQRLIDEVQETIREAPKQLQSSFQKRLAEVKMPKLLPEPTDKK